MSKYILDTNYILRYFLADCESQFQEAQKLFLQIMGGRISAILSESVFIEVIYVLSSFYEVPKDKIIDILESFLSYKGIICEKEILLKALGIYKQNNVHIVDSIIKARSEIDNLKILSFDKKLQNINID